MKIQKNPKNIINKKNILTKRYFFNLFLLLTMIIATTGGIGYYFFKNLKKPVYEIIVNKNTIFQTALLHFFRQLLSLKLFFKTKN
ncbi:hypothetical protein [Candidatus Phytoplasma asteris]|uniref:hypothetical protein n=1 Tax=Candidatus Phytoplasma asteris TaxID=85620 RepID=UPI0031450F17